MVLYVFDSPKMDFKNLLNLLLETTWFASTLDTLPQLDEVQCGNISSEKTPSASFIWCLLVLVGNAPLRVHLLHTLMILGTSSTSAFCHSFSRLMSLCLNSYFSYGNHAVSLFCISTVFLFLLYYFSDEETRTAH